MEHRIVYLRLRYKQIKEFNHPHYLVYNALTLSFGKDGSSAQRARGGDLDAKTVTESESGPVSEVPVALLQKLEQLQMVSTLEFAKWYLAAVLNKFVNFPDPTTAPGQLQEALAVCILHCQTALTARNVFLMFRQNLFFCNLYPLLHVLLSGAKVNKLAQSSI